VAYGDFVEENQFTALTQSLKERETRLIASEEENVRLRLQLEDDRKALERVIELHQKVAAMRRGYSEIPDSPVDAETVKSALLNAIVFVSKRTKVFSSTDIIAHWQGLPQSQRPKFDIDKNRANISAYLRDFEHSKAIQVVEKGSGRRPYTYKIGALALL